MTTDLRRKIEIRTPEGVAFSLDLAGPFTRFLAWLVDVFVIMAVSSAVATGAQQLGLFFGGVAMAVAIVLLFAFSFAYRIVMEWKFRGQTLGKRLFRLRVMDISGLRLQPSQIVLRNLLRLVDMMPVAYLLGGTTMLLNRHHQRLGDIAANCIVTYLPRDESPDFAQVLPGKYNSFRDYPHLEARLRQRVTPEEADLLVQALLRRNELDAPERVALYTELATHFREKATFPEEAVLGITDEQYLRNVVDTVFRGKK